MKKVCYLFGFFSLLLFVSCSKSDDIIDTSSLDSDLLLQKQIEIVGDDVGVSEFKYDGYKIISQTYDTKLFTYEYTGDLITKITLSFEGANGKTQTREQLFQYNENNTLSQVTELYHYDDPYAPIGFKVVYTHNPDNTISFNEFTGDLIAQNTPNGSGVYFFNQDGEVSKYEKYSGDGTVSLSVDFSYDTKKAPLGNVTGYDKLFYINVGKKHNITFNTIDYNNKDSQIQITYDYEYNDAGYPVNLSVTHLSEDSLLVNKSVQYIY